MFRRKTAEQSLDAELRFHIEQLARSYVEQGLTPDEALRRARLEFGGLDQVKESCRDIRTSRYFADFLQDLRFGGRMLKKSWRTAALSVFVIGIGVGANIAAFSIADAFLLRPLRIPGIERVVRILGVDKNRPDPVEEFTPSDYLTLKRDNQSFENVAAWNSFTGTISGKVGPEVADGLGVSSNFFDVFGVKAAQGRTFNDDDVRDSSDRSAVISYNLWARQYASSPEAVGSVVRVDGRDYRIAGVAPQGFHYLSETDLWVLLSFTPKERAEADIANLKLTARLRPGVTVQQANSEVAAFFQRAASSRGERSARTVPVMQRFASDDDENAYVYLLWIAAFLLLVVAIANVANLQYARVSLRDREMAIRTALGAGRLRLIRQLSTESALLGVLGCVVGTWGALAAVSLLRSSFPANLVHSVDGWDYFAVNPRALAYGLGAAVMAGVLAGIAPALLASSIRPSNQLKAGDRAASAGRSRHRLRNVLVVIQISFSCVLLAGAALVTASARGVSEPIAGTDPDLALRFRMVLTESDFAGADQIRQFQTYLLQGLGSVPGVKTAALISHLPYSGSAEGGSYFVEGRPFVRGRQLPSLLLQSASADYFQAMHIPIVKGRPLAASDDNGALLVGVVSEALAREQFPGENPIGRRIKLFSFQPGQPWVTIVGVAKDVMHFDGQPPQPTLYRPYRQAPGRYFNILLRTSVPPMQISQSVLAKLRALNPSQAADSVQTLRELYNDQNFALKWLATLVSVLGTFALILAAMGVFGVVANAVLERKKEIAIRMAFGAGPEKVTWMVLQQGAMLAAAGSAIGIGVSAMLSRVVVASIPEVRPAGFWLYVSVAAFLTIVVALACYLPARQAALTDPAVTLRSE